MGKLQKHRQELMDSFNLASEAMEGKSGAYSYPETPLQADKGEKERRNKLGARRRGWLPMR